MTGYDCVPKQEKMSGIRSFEAFFFFKDPRKEPELSDMEGRHDWQRIINKEALTS